MLMTNQIKSNQGLRIPLYMQFRIDTYYQLIVISDNIESTSDNAVWQMILQLGQINEIICAPAISSGQIALLIRKYLDSYLKLLKFFIPWWEVQCRTPVHQ